MRRVPTKRFDDIADVEALARARTRSLVLIFDADNTLVPQGIPAGEFGERINAFIDRFESVSTVERMIVLTNGPARGVDRIESRGNKPWTSRRRLGLIDSESDVWVVGDQILTDGFLAWRLNATYLHRPIAERGEPGRQAVMRAVGTLLHRLLFRRLD